MIGGGSALEQAPPGRDAEKVWNSRRGLRVKEGVPQGGQMRLRRLIQDDSDAGPDMSPMIDIVFNLLIFFLCATKFKTAEGAIDTYLPKDQGICSLDQQVEIDEVRVTVSWRANSSGSEAATVRLGANLLTRPGDWDVADSTQSPVWPRLAAALQDLKDGHQGAKPLSVTLDIRPEVPHQYAVSTLNEVIRVGLKEVRFAAPSRD
jgi:biopolymer transport protein ExbD